MSDEGFMDSGESAAELLESMAMEGYESITPAEMLEGFVARTPRLEPAERAEILAAALGSEGAAEVDWGRTGRDVQTYTQLGAGLANLAGTLAGAFGGQSGRDAQRILQGIGAVGGSLGNMAGGVMQQYGRPQPGQVRPVSRPAPSGPIGGMAPRPPMAPPPPGLLPPGPSPMAPPPAGLLPPGLQVPMTGGFGSPAPMSGPVGTDATAMLQQLLGNPQLLQALAGGIIGGPTASREVVLEIAGREGEAEQVAIPLGAVMNAIATLATEAMVELNAMTHEAEPEVPDYLVAESGELIVDPASAEDRAALVVEYFRRARDAERAGLVGGLDEGDWGAFEDDEGFEGFEDDEGFDFP